LTYIDHLCIQNRSLKKGEKKEKRRGGVGGIPLKRWAEVQSMKNKPYSAATTGNARGKKKGRKGRCKF